MQRHCNLQQRVATEPPRPIRPNREFRIQNLFRHHFRNGKNRSILRFLHTSLPLDNTARKLRDAAISRRQHLQKPTNADETGKNSDPRDANTRQKTLCRFRPEWFPPHSESGFHGGNFGKTGRTERFCGLQQHAEQPNQPPGCDYKVSIASRRLAQAAPNEMMLSPRRMKSCNEPLGIT